MAALLLGFAIARAGETNLPVQALGGGWFRVGEVTIDQSNRVARFPATMNLREETVEYAVVHKTGKTHESIFRTDARPQDVHMAMLLLRVKATMTNRFGLDGKGLPPGEKVWIEAGWTNDGARVEFPIEKLVMNKQTGQPLTRGEWIYNGSNFSEGAFTAQRDGSIVSIHIDPDALINNPRPGRENDDLYAPDAKTLPAIGARIDIVIRLKAR